MASRRAHTRVKLDSEVLYGVGNPESLIRHRHGKEKINTSQVERSFSQNQEEYFTFQDFKLETNLENSMLRYKYEFDLK